MENNEARQSVVAEERAPREQSQDSDLHPHKSPTRPPKRTSDELRYEPSAIYCAIANQIEIRRRALGLPMERLSEFAGIAERGYPKYLAPGTQSGRQPQWGTLQSICDVLFADGLDITITARNGPRQAELLSEFFRRYPTSFRDGGAK